MIKTDNKYKVFFYKGIWTDDDKFLAECLDIKEDENKMIADIRVVSREALFTFAKNSMPIFVRSKQSKTVRDLAFSQIKEMYKRTAYEFLDNYYSKLKYPNELYRHQKESLFEMINRQHTLLSLEQGLGKTVVSASVSKMLSIPRTIIVCPSLVKWNWFRNMTDDWGFNPLYWTIYDSKRSQMIKAFRERFVVVNYEMVNKFFDELTKDSCGHIIIDECHYIKNPKSNRAKAVKKLIKHYSDAKVSLLSGTPITNRINDLYGYLNVCGHPLGKSENAFKSKYCVTSSVRGGKAVIGSKNVPDLRDKIKNFMIRKKTEECIDLPALTINKYYIDTKEVKEKYDEELDRFYENKMTFDSLTDEKERSKMKIKMKGNIHTLNRITSTAKVETIANLINELWENGRKVIVFAGYKDALSGLEKIYKDKCVKIDGSVTSHKRDALITKFKTDPECHVFLGNFKAAGVGINLTNSRDVIFMNFPFTPDDLEQPYKRAHRIGQTQNVNVYYTIGKDTIDENVFEIITNKTKDINELIDNKKKGVIHYDSIPDKLFNDLFNKRKT